MSLFETIVPIFLIILLGSLIRKSGFLKEEFYSEANRFVYFLCLPALIFTGIIKSGLATLPLTQIASVVLPTLFTCLFGTGLGLALGLKNGRLGSFVQTTYHGNVSYIGLAIVFYMLGEEGLKQGSIVVGFLILTTNALSTIVLSLTTAQTGRRHPLKPFVSIARNPVIISSLAGILFLHLKIPVHAIITRGMGIMANVALPLALITIGASLTIGSLTKSLKTALLSALVKLLLLPYLGILCVRHFRVPAVEGFICVLLLATPAATLAYLMAEEMGGDGEFASSSVTLTTMLSPFTYMFWAVVLGIK